MNWKINLYSLTFIWTNNKQIYKRSSVLDNHLSRLIVTNKLKCPTKCKMRATSFYILTWTCSGWGLHGFPSHLGNGELLPRLFILTTKVAVIFCCTFLRITPTRRYLAPCSMELRLSSCRENLYPRLSDLLTI